MCLHSISSLTFPVFLEVILEIYLFAFTFHSQYPKVISVLSVLQQFEMLYINYIFVTDSASAKISQFWEMSLRLFLPRLSLVSVGERSKEKERWRRYECRVVRKCSRHAESKACVTSHRFFCLLAVRNSPSRHNLSANYSAFARKHHSPTSADLYRFSPSLHHFLRLFLLSTCAEI